MFLLAFDGRKPLLREQQQYLARSTGEECEIGNAMLQQNCEEEQWLIVCV